MGLCCFDFVIRFFKNVFFLLADIAPYFLVGLLVAGALKTFLPQEKLTKHLGGHGLLAIFKAAALGVPLPLCSCGALPVAISLYRHGASLPATLAFLVATPQTGVDAILITLGLFGPAFALAYALAALFAGVFVGIVAKLFLSGPLSSDATCECLSCITKKRNGWREMIGFAYGELLSELTRPLVIGLLLAALLTTVFPQGFLGQYIPTRPGQYLLMLLAGVPIYMCSTGSLPLAYSLYLQGFSPGSLLVFLMSGPATNLTSLVVIRKALSGRVFMLYLISLVTFALLAGFLLDLLGPKIYLKPFSPSVEEISLVKIISAVILGSLLLYHLLRPLFGRSSHKG